MTINTFAIQRHPASYKFDCKTPAAQEARVATANIIDLKKFRESHQFLASNRIELLIQGHVSVDNFEQTRDVLIEKYRQIERNSVYLKNSPTFQTKI